MLWRIKNPDEKELPNYSPTVLELAAYRLDDGTFIEFVDTAGQDDYKDVRVQCYHGADLFIILCAADNRNTLENVKLVLYKHFPNYGRRNRSNIFERAKISSFPNMPRYNCHV